MAMWMELPQSRDGKLIWLGETVNEVQNVVNTGLIKNNMGF